MSLRDRRAHAISQALSRRRGANRDEEIVAKQLESPVVALTPTKSLPTPSTPEDEFLGLFPVTSNQLNYDDQHLALLQAMVSGQKEGLLSVDSKQARALATRSKDLVTDADMWELFTNARESTKQEIARKCAKAKRHEIVQKILQTWFDGNSDRKRIARIELLPFLQAGWDGFISLVKIVLDRGLEAKSNSSYTSDDVRIMACMRWDLLWKFHSHALINAIEEDLKQCHGSLLGHFRVWSFWDSAFKPASWKRNGDLTKISSKQVLANQSSFVPWKELLALYCQYLPFEPSNTVVNDEFKRKIIPRLVPEQLAENPTLRAQVNVMETKYSIDDLRGNCDNAVVGFDEMNEINIFVPDWINAYYAARFVEPEAYLKLAWKRPFMRDDGVFVKKTFSLARAMTVIAFSNTGRRFVRFSNQNQRFSEMLFQMVKSMLSKSLTLLDARSFHFPNLDAMYFQTKQEFAWANEKSVTTTFVLNDLVLQCILNHDCISIGQQLEVFQLLKAKSIEYLVKTTDFPESSLLGVISPKNIKEMLTSYGLFLSPYAHEVLKSVTTKMHLAMDRDKHQSVATLNTLFENVTQLAVFNVEDDLQSAYREFAPRYPMVFSSFPPDRILTHVAPLLSKYSDNKMYLVDDGKRAVVDEPNAMLESILVNVVLPRVSSQTLGFDALFVDILPDHEYAKYRTSAEPSKQIQGYAMESMQLMRLKWLNHLTSTSSSVGTLFNQPNLLKFSTTMGILDLICAWADSAAEAVNVAKQAKDLENSQPRAAHVAAASYPKQVPNADKLLVMIAGRLKSFVETEIQRTQRNARFESNYLEKSYELISHAFAGWTTATYPMMGKNPLISGDQTLNPYVLDAFVTFAYQLPRPVLTKSLKCEFVLLDLFLLRMRGEVRAEGKTFKYTKLGMDEKPWENCVQFFTQVFSNSPKTARADEVENSQAVLDFLTKNGSAPALLIKALEGYMDISNPQVRKRLEDLNKPLIPDRVQAVEVLLECTARLKNKPGEISKSLERAINLMRGEQKPIRISMIQTLLGWFSDVYIHSAMPRAGWQAGGFVFDASSAKRNRLFVQYLNEAPEENTLGVLQEAALKQSELLLTMLDDLIQSQDAKLDSDFHMFRVFGSQVATHALTWPCTAISSGADKRILEIQQIWFDFVVELQWRWNVFKFGKAQAANTFRLLLGPKVERAVQDFILEAGFQSDLPFPHQAVETRAWESQARLRRTAQAKKVADLYVQAMESRIGVRKPGMSFGRKADAEKKRLVDLIELIQGEWTSCEFLVKRFEDVVLKQTSSTLPEAHHGQVLALVKECTGASVDWAYRCLNERPAWAYTVPTGKIHRRFRASDGGGGMRAKPTMRTTFGRGGRGGQKKKVDKNKTINETEIVKLKEFSSWCSSSEMKFVPDMIKRYWENCVKNFGIHLPIPGETKSEEGRAVLRLYLRWQLSLADGESHTRAHRTTRRNAVALSLLEICASAVHIKFVQDVLKNFEQSALDQFVFDKDVLDPILGKFSSECAGAKELELHSDEERSVEAEADSPPFRLSGFYGFEKLPFRQGRKLAERLVADVKRVDESTVVRLRAMNKLRFVPAVDYRDFCALLNENVEQKALYAASLRKRQSMKDLILASPPFPSSVLDAGLRAVLNDTNPHAMVSLLSKSMMRDNASAKIVMLVAQRAATRLVPEQVLAVARVLFGRRNRDALNVGPLKAFLRILFPLASSSASTVSKEVCDGARALIMSQWTRASLHVDARAAIFFNALEELSVANVSSSLDNEIVLAQDSFWVWRVLSDVSSISSVAAAQTSLFSMPLNVKSLILACGPEASVFDTQFDVSYTDLAEISKNAMRFGKVEVSSRVSSRFIRCILKSRATLNADGELCLAQATTSFETNPRAKNLQTKRKLGNACLDIRALLSVNIHRFVGPNQDDFVAVWNELNFDMKDFSDASLKYPNLSSRNRVYNEVIPRRMSELALAVYRHDASAEKLAVVSNLAELTTTLLGDLVRVVLRDYTVEEYEKRHAAALRVGNFVKILSTSSSLRTSLYCVAYSKPFRSDLFLLRKQVEMTTAFNSMLVISDE